MVHGGDENKMFIVCDGMGGHACGDIASKTICDSISVYWDENQHENDTIGKVCQAAKEAQETLDEVSGHYQMGTTMVMASIEGQNAMIAHAGDSRCYVIEPLTTWKQEQHGFLISTGHSSLDIKSRPCQT